MEKAIDACIDALGASGANFITLLIWSENYNNNCLRFRPDGTMIKGMILAPHLVNEFMISKIFNFEWDFEQIRQELEFA